MANGLPDNYEFGLDEAEPVNPPQVKISPVTVLPNLTGEQAIDQAAGQGFDPDTADSSVNPDNITFEDQPVSAEAEARQRRARADQQIKAETDRQQLIEQTAPSGADAVASTGDPELDGLVNETVQGAEAVAREHGERVREDQRRAVNELMNQQEQAAITQEMTAIAGPAGGYMVGEAFKGFNDGFQRAIESFKTFAQAELAAAGITAEGAKQREAIEKGALADIEKQTAPIKSQITQTLRNIAQADADVRNGRVAPNRVWNNMETWRKVAVTAGAAMANVLSVRLGKGLPAQNPVLAELDKTIQNDIRGQEIELNRLFRTAGHERANLQSLQFQADKIRANILGNKALKVSSVIAHMESELATKVVPDKVRAAMMKNISELEKLRAGFYADMGKTAGQMYQRAAMLSAKNVGQRIVSGRQRIVSGRPKADPKDPVVSADPWGVIQNDPKTNDVPWKADVGTAEREKVRNAWGARKQMVQQLNKLAQLTVERENGLRRGNRSQSEMSALADQARAILTDLGRKEAGAGANFTETEMQLIRDAMALDYQGWLKGGPAIQKRIQAAIGVLRDKHIDHLRTVVDLKESEFNKFNEVIQYVPPRPAEKGAASSDRGVSNGRQQRLTKLASEKGPAAALETAAQATDKSPAYASKNVVETARALLDQVRSDPGSTTAQRASAQQNFERVARPARLLTAKKQLKAAKKEMWQAAESGDKAAYKKARDKHSELEDLVKGLQGGSSSDVNSNWSGEPKSAK